MNKEVWKDITGFKGIYQVSSKGNFKSLDRIKIKKNGAKTHIKGRTLKTTIKHGYEYCPLFDVNGKVLMLRAHRLIATEFIPNEEGKPYVNHKDYDRLNNDIKNLEWCTASENIKHGLIRNPHNNAAKLSKGKVLLIKEMREYSKTAFTYRWLGKCFGVTSPAISDIFNNKTWKNV